MTELAASIDTLSSFIVQHRPVFVITGAGISTSSGIPDYRDRHGLWKHAEPIQWQAFQERLETRQRYWARSLIGWPRFAAAQPSPTHYALTHLESAQLVAPIVTQNVDSLHQRAGSRAVIELHGSLASVVCLRCSRRYERAEIQTGLVAQNPAYLDLASTVGPDGDARLDETVDLSHFKVPSCPVCGGLLKPDVVFFGDNVPKQRVHTAHQALGRARGLLIVGTSLMAFSSYRFCVQATNQRIPMAAVNVGRTRADDRLALKIEATCDTILPPLVDALLH